MKCLTLTQPWATLVAIRAKRIETRSWSTSYRGPLAIHAAKGFPADARDFLYAKAVRELLKPHFHGELPLDKQLPLGKVIAIGKLHACVPTVQLLERGTYRPDMTEQEQNFGNFEEGRWGWMLLGSIEALKEPDPAKGSLGLWDWDETAYWKRLEVVV